MTSSEQTLLADIEKVKKIPIVETMLEVICRSTGMGFAAVARVTENRWIACSVLDEIGFGLEPGGELSVGTTICDEIRDHGQAVVIDHVDASQSFCNHPTPAMYGFQSYISVPIFRKNGEFFGTLCAIDPNPADLQNPRVIGMFRLFTELLAFHLESMDLMEQTHSAVEDLNRQLSDSLDENRQYRHISSHNLQEPLRKLRIFSDMLADAAGNGDKEKTRELAFKIRSSAQRFSMMIKDLSDFSGLNHKSDFANVDLSHVLSDVTTQLQPHLKQRNVTIELGSMPVVYAIPAQMEQLFYQLLHNAVKFSSLDEPPRIRISSREFPLYELDDLLPEPLEMAYTEIRIADNGPGIDDAQLEKVFDIFSRLPTGNIQTGEGVGLAYCRKIVRNHKGIIKAESTAGKGTTFVITLPLKN
nr:GAF domain-containing sensor histidine kinase [uncultured Dyadobacter sp.]